MLSLITVFPFLLEVDDLDPAELYGVRVEPDSARGHVLGLSNGVEAVLLARKCTTNWPVLTAALTISVVPIVAVYVRMQRQFVAGLTMGAVKTWDRSCGLWRIESD